MFDPTSAFALGSAGGTTCPLGKVNVLDPAECAKAAASAARPYAGEVSNGLPSGCVWLTLGGKFFFNEVFGDDNVVAPPVCAGPFEFAQQYYRSECVQRCAHMCVCAPARLAQSQLKLCLIILL